MLTYADVRSTSAGGKPAMDAKPAEFDEDDFEKELGL